MRRIAVFLFLVSSLTAQGFDAASVKSCPPGDPRAGSMEFLPGGRFRATNMPLFLILATAYNVPSGTPDTLRIRNMPAWAFATRFDIEATPDNSASPSAPVTTRNQRIRGLLQAVLVSRFKLRIHRESKEVPVYALTAGSHGPRLETSKIVPRDCKENSPTGSGAGCHQFSGGMGRGMHGEAVDMADLALYASNWSDRPILDQTGLTGLYKVQTDPWGAPIIDDPSRPSLDEIFDRMGLQLAARKGQVEFWVIDRIEKPSAN